MPKSTCSSMHPRRQRQRRATRILAQAPPVERPPLDILQVVGRGLLGGWLGVLIDALRPSWSASNSGKRSGRIP